MRYLKLLFSGIVAAALLGACRETDEIFIPEEVEIGTPEFTDVTGFYLLNEGNMGSNKSTLDYYDYTTATYMRNIYGAANPDVPKELGDVGNDLQIYGQKMYAVVNCSNKVEVMDARTARRLGAVKIPNCRMLAFKGGYAYATSYAGPVQIDPDYKQRGYVAKIDTATLAVVDTCLVGFQPDGLAVVGEKLYVANSGGYMIGRFDHTVSVIDLLTFREEERIDIGMNPHYCVADRQGKLWVSCRGNYGDVKGSLVCYDTRKRRIVERLDLSVGALWQHGDSLYVIASQWVDATMSRATGFAIVNTRTLSLEPARFMTQEVQTQLRVPYGIAVNPANGDVIVSDARNYVTPGALYCLSPVGELKWMVRTGDIPAHIAFTGSKK